MYVSILYHKCMYVHQKTNYMSDYSLLGCYEIRDVSTFMWSYTIITITITTKLVAYAQDILMCEKLMSAVMFAARIGNSYLSEQKMVAIHSWGRHARVNIEIIHRCSESLIHTPREQHCLVHFIAVSFLVFQYKFSCSSRTSHKLLSSGIFRKLCFSNQKLLCIHRICLQMNFMRQIK